MRRCNVQAGKKQLKRFEKINILRLTLNVLDSIKRHDKQLAAH